MGKGNSGGGTVYRDDPDARARQERSHQDEMQRLERSHHEQMKILQETLAKTTEALGKITQTSGISDDRYDKKTATLEDTRNLSKKLEKKRKEFKPVAAKMEGTLHETAQSGFDLILSEVEAIKKASKLSLDIDAIKQKVTNFTKQIDGSISGVLDTRVALSDQECADILAEESEEDRERELGIFFKKVVKESVKNSGIKIDEVMSESLNMVASTITNRINDKKQELQRAAQELESMQKVLSESEIIQKQKQYDSELAVFDEFLSTLGKTSA
jgi:ABC-type transporter Mla subunit MlaD